MLKNYLKVAFRGMIRSKLFSAINIISLATSMSVGLFIIAMLHDLARFDTFHENRERIFRVNSSIQYQNYSPNNFASTTDAVAGVIAGFNDVERVTRIRRGFRGDFGFGDTKIPLSGHFADEHFFQVFSFSTQSLESALVKPFTMVITRSAAEKLFGEIDAVGQMVEVTDWGTFTITAVINDVPKHSHIQFEVLGSYSSLPALEGRANIAKTLDNWSELYRTYVYGLATNEIPVHLLPQINTLTQSHYSKEDPIKAQFYFQSLNSIIPGNDVSNNIGPKMIYLPLIILSVIAVAILLSACFNYTNLSVARALKRAKEFGLRKVSGGTRRQVFIQFMSETILISMLALLLAIQIFVLFRGDFLQVVPRASEILTLELTFPIVASFSLFAIFAGVVAGLLPALYFTNINPIEALKGTAGLKLLNRLSLRKVLVTAQFAISIIFITGVVIIAKQYRFSMNYDLGFNRDRIVHIPLSGTDPERVSYAMTAFEEVEAVGFSSLVPGSGSRQTTWLTTGADSVEANYMVADEGYFQSLQLEITEGVFPQNTRQVIVNETMRKQLGEAYSPGMLVTWQGQEMIISGVMKDWHYMHLEEAIQPFFIANTETYTYASLLLNTTELPATLQKLEEEWSTITTSSFSFEFFDEKIAETYSFLTNFMKIFGFLGIVAMIISLLGMLGMSVYTMETRMKELGIRKVLGASGLTISYIFSRSFLKLVVFAAAIGLPLTYLLFDKVILAFNYYRTDIGLADLSVSFLGIMVFSMLSIGLQALRAARLNPSSTLRHE